MLLVRGGLGRLSLRVQPLRLFKHVAGAILGVGSLARSEVIRESPHREECPERPEDLRRHDAPQPFAGTPRLATCVSPAFRRCLTYDLRRPASISAGPINAV